MIQRRDQARLAHLRQSHRRRRAESDDPRARPQSAEARDLAQGRLSRGRGARSWPRRGRKRSRSTRRKSESGPMRGRDTMPSPVRSCSSFKLNYQACNDTALPGAGRLEIPLTLPSDAEKPASEETHEQDDHHDRTGRPRSADEPRGIRRGGGTRGGALRIEPGDRHRGRNTQEAAHAAGRAAIRDQLQTYKALNPGPASRSSPPATSASCSIPALGSERHPIWPCYLTPPPEEEDEEILGALGARDRGRGGFTELAKARLRGEARGIPAVRRQGILDRRRRQSGTDGAAAVAGPVGRDQGRAAGIHRTRLLPGLEFSIEAVFKSAGLA